MHPVGAGCYKPVSQSAVSVFAAFLKREKEVTQERQALCSIFTRRACVTCVLSLGRLPEGTQQLPEVEGCACCCCCVFVQGSVLMNFNQFGELCWTRLDVCTAACWLLLCSCWFLYAVWNLFTYVTCACLPRVRSKQCQQAAQRIAVTCCVHYATGRVSVS